MSQPGDFSEEIEDSQCCSLKLLGEEEGYEADSESNPEDGDAHDDGKMSLMLVVGLPSDCKLAKWFIVPLPSGLTILKRHCIVILFDHHITSAI